MSQSVLLVLANEVGPERFYELVTELGGEVRLDEWHAARLCRGGTCVWVEADPPGTFPGDERFVTQSARLLGRPPYSVVTIDMPRAPEAEWIALDLVLAAADRWHLILLDVSGEMITYAELSERVERRPHQFFLPDTWYRYSPVAARRSMAYRVTLLFPAGVEPEAFIRLMRSLGATIKPDEETEAHLSRPGADIWVYRCAPDEPLVPEGQRMAFEAVLGPPPYHGVDLEMSRTKQSALLAVEVVEAAATRWTLLISGPVGHVTTVDELRLRVQADTDEIFPSEA